MPYLDQLTYGIDPIRPRSNRAPQQRGRAVVPTGAPGCTIYTTRLLFTRRGQQEFREGTQMILSRARRWPLACVATIVFGAVSSAASAADPGALLASKGNDKGAAPCSSCHGERGEGNAAGGFPRLAGLGKSYIERQLDAFASGERQNAVMAPIAKALNAAERTAAAAYFAKIPFAAPAGAEVRAGEGAVLATRGRWDKEIVPACVQCHGPNGMGVGDSFPPLAGQSAAYIGQQLRAWQEGTRGPGPLGLMKAIATRLTANDVDAVAQYFGAMSQPAKDRKVQP